MNNAQVIRTLQRALRDAAEPERAAGAQAYMKSTMPFYGVTAPNFKVVCREVFGAVQFQDAKEWRALVLAIWRGAKFREERYGAVALCQIRNADAFHTMEALPVFEEMIVDGAWWDYVDSLAANNVGKLLRRYPREMKREMLAWSKCGDMWKQRTSILCQLKFKEETDLSLLYRCIEPSIASKEFFLRKAIGWALRQHAWTDPTEVLRYVAENEARLSGLSKREALKNIR